MPQDNSRHSILSKDGEWVPSPSAPGEYGAKPPCSITRPHLQLRTATALSRRMAEAACDERREDAAMLLDHGVRFLHACQDAGLPADYIDDAARGLRDQLSNLMAGINRDLDREAATEATPLDMSELDAMWEQDAETPVSSGPEGDGTPPARDAKDDARHVRDYIGKASL